MLHASDAWHCLDFGENKVPSPSPALRPICAGKFHPDQSNSLNVSAGDDDAWPEKVLYNASRVCIAATTDPMSSTPLQVKAACTISGGGASTAANRWRAQLYYCGIGGPCNDANLPRFNATSALCGTPPCNLAPTGAPARLHAPGMHACVCRVGSKKYITLKILSYTRCCQF